MRRREISLFLGLVLVLFLFSPPGRGLFLRVSKPIMTILVQAGQTTIAVPARFFASLSDINTLIRENEELTKKVRQLEAERAFLVEKERENEILREQFKFLQNQHLNMIAANVIGRFVDLQYLILDRGNQDGIRQGQVVLYQGWLVGKIVEVNPTTSKVALVSNPSLVVPVISQETRQAGLVKGELGYGLIMEEVPKEKPLQVGENVVTSGLGGEFPKGLLVGQIQKVISSSADLFQKASLSSIDLRKLEIVFVTY